MCAQRQILLFCRPRIKDSRLSSTTTTLDADIGEWRDWLAVFGTSRRFFLMVPRIFKMSYETIFRIRMSIDLIDGSIRSQRCDI